MMKQSFRIHSWSFNKSINQSLNVYMPRPNMYLIPTQHFSVGAIQYSEEALPLVGIIKHRRTIEFIFFKMVEY